MQKASSFITVKTLQVYEYCRNSWIYSWFFFYFVFKIVKVLPPSVWPWDHLLLYRCILHAVVGSFILNIHTYMYLKKYWARKKQTQNPICKWKAVWLLLSSWLFSVFCLVVNILFSNGCILCTLWTDWKWQLLMIINLVLSINPIRKKNMQKVVNS